MKSAIWAAIVAAGVGGFVASGFAQDSKKLTPHPAAAKDVAGRTGAPGSVDLPTTASRSRSNQSGATGVADAKPATDNAVGSGGKSTARSRQ